MRSPASGDPKYSPASGYRYDGLYRIVDVWPEQNSDGFRIWRFHLVKADAPEPSVAGGGSLPHEARCEV
ncbi:YDG/SRA domain-containing protein [Amycolatopsis sp. NPDC049253]|uniref:YDG/SRA domain-containing protein n=1 Tax=Amycolatopsis sp. NPDC049253 TaxID=3155274 RepID=UPI0034173F65